MGFREVSLVEIREVLRRKLRREGSAGDRPQSGGDRKTVRRYVRAEAVGVVERCGANYRSPPRRLPRPNPPPARSRATTSKAAPSFVRGWESPGTGPNILGSDWQATTRKVTARARVSAAAAARAAANARRGWLMTT